MNAPADPQRTRDLALIHAAAKRAGLDEDTYRLMVETVTGQASCKDLDAAGRAAVMARLGLDVAAARGGLTLPRPALVSAPQWKYIGDLCRRLQIDDRHFRALVRHMTGLDDPAWLDVPTGRAVLSGLIRMEAHAQRTGGAARRVPARGNPRRRDG